MSKSLTTYQQQYYEPRLFELAKESGAVYSKTLAFFWRIVRKKNVWLSKYTLEKYCYNSIDRKLLHSTSFQGAIQQFCKNLNTWRKAKKVVTNSKPPHKRRFLAPIIFKKSAIKYKDGFLELSLAKGLKPMLIKYNPNLAVPKYITINYNRNKGWLINLSIEKEVKYEDLDKSKLMSIDLGIKRIATTFNGKDVITYSGKYIKSLIRLRNKVDAKTKSFLSTKKKNSKAYKKIKNAKRRVSLRIQNKINNFLHKTSKQIVDHAKKNEIGKIIIGDCSGIHKNTNCGKQNNQTISQNVEQKLRKFIEYKFKSIGGWTEVVPEHYTSQTCPNCNQRNKPKNRLYRCTKCHFCYDRDGVGAINIFKVSFGEQLNVVGFLTKPIGVKYRDCLTNHLLK